MLFALAVKASVCQLSRPTWTFDEAGVIHSVKANREGTTHHPNSILLGRGAPPGAHVSFKLFDCAPMRLPVPLWSSSPSFLHMPSWCFSGRS
eukprot:scaffold274085_cov28-Tisochrysis_lutea.AAC.3